jgi:hypothetical protein
MQPKVIHLAVERLGVRKTLKFQLERADKIARQNGKRFVGAKIVPFWANDKDVSCFD